MRYLGYLTVFAFLVGAQPGTSRAQAQPAPMRCEDVSECGRLTNEAYAHWQAGRFIQAQRVYEQAYKRWPDAVLLYNLARVLHRAQRPAEAIPYYEKYLQSGAEGSEEQRRKAEQYVEQARREAGLPQPSSVSSFPSSAGPAPAPRPAAPSSNLAAPAAALTAEAGAAHPFDVSKSSSVSPVYKKWWFWTVIGAAAATVAVGVGIGVTTRQPDLSDAAHSYPFQG